MTPLLLFRVVAVAEACSWVGLLVGMFFKWVLQTTEVGVQVFGPIHGALFMAYVAITLVVGLMGRWPLGRLALGLASSVPPLMTLWFDRRAERAGWLPTSWRQRQAA
jgi:integral membrane protein